jgi:hypothetical protein
MMNLKLRLQMLYVSAIAGYLVLGVIPLEAWLTKFVGPNLSPWGNVHIAQGAFLVAALASAIYAVAVSSTKVDSADKLLFHLLVGVLMVNASFLLIHFWKYLTHIVPDTWSEEVIYLSAVKPGSIFALYSTSNLEQPPFLLSIYPPVWYLVQKFFFSFFGQSTLVGRYVSVGAILIIALFLSLVPRRGVEKVWSLTAPLLFLSIMPILAWGGTLAHPEFLAASFSLGGFLVYLRRGLVEGTSWILRASVLCAMALLTKPSVLAVPAAIAIHLLWDRRFKECVKFASLVLLWFLGTYAALWWPTEGGIWLMTIAGNAVKLTPLHIADFGIARITSPFVVLALAASALFLFARGARRQVDVAASLYFLIALCWFVVSVARPGSGSHYFVQSAMGGSLVIGLLISKYGADGNWASFKLAVILLMLSMLLNLAPQFGWAARALGNGRVQPETTRALSNLKTGPEEYILADPQYSLAVVEAGHRPIINDSHPYTLMVENGIVSTKPLMDQLRNNRVRYLVLVDTLEKHARGRYGSRLWPVEVVDYLAQNYSCTLITEKGVGNKRLVICDRNAGDSFVRKELR